MARRGTESEFELDELFEQGSSAYYGNNRWNYRLGAKHPQARLSQREVEEIAARVQAGESRQDLAEEFDISIAMIGHIQSGYSHSRTLTS